MADGVQEGEAGAVDAVVGVYIVHGLQEVSDVTEVDSGFADLNQIRAKRYYGVTLFEGETLLRCKEA